MNFDGASRKKTLNRNIDANTRGKESADTDFKFNEIMNRTGKITFNGTVSHNFTFLLCTLVLPYPLIYHLFKPWPIEVHD